MESNSNVKFERRFVNDKHEKGRCLFSDMLYAGTEEYQEQTMKLNTITFCVTNISPIYYNTGFT
jgi:hypothetical protein